MTKWVALSCAGVDWLMLTKFKPQLGKMANSNQMRPNKVTCIHRVRVIEYGMYSGSKKCPNVCMLFTKVDNP